MTACMSRVAVISTAEIQRYQNTISVTSDHQTSTPMVALHEVTGKE